MNLAPGQRLSTGERSAFEILGPARETARHRFFRARKVLWNLRPSAPFLYEADPDECLDVLIRVPLELDLHPGPADLRFELEAVLGIADAPGLPLPIDVIEGPDGPALVLADLPGGPLPEGPPPGPEALARVVRLAREALELLAALHRRGLAAGPFDRGDFTIDADGRWAFLATDRVASAPSPAASAEDAGRWAVVFAGVLTGTGADGSPPAIAGLADGLNGPDRDEARWLIDRLRRGLGGPSASASAEELLRAAEPVGSLRSAFGAIGRRFLGGRSDDR